MKKKILKAEDILQRYIEGRCTPEERSWVEVWYYTNSNIDRDIDENQAEHDLAKIWQNLATEITPKRKKTVLFKIASAAAMLTLIATAITYLWIYTDTISNSNVKLRSQIHPGTNQATLTLSDGQLIKLDSAHIEADDLKNNILKITDIVKKYEVQEAQDLYTLSTPRGGQYEFILPDNSIVKLNASSSLKFPANFTKGDRIVELQGEAYFEIVTDSNRPFSVKSHNQTTTVKGTKFNISAYPDDQQTVTTLLEGSVGVKLNNQISARSMDEIILKPNEQSISTATGITKEKVFAMETISWINGKFFFNNTPLPTIMKQISRWYNVDITYLDNVDDIYFTGSISRFDDIQDVLRKIALTESIQLETKGRRIMVKH